MPLEDLYSTLVSAGGMGILSGVLLWIYVTQSKRLDAQQDAHLTLLGDWKAERVETIEALKDETVMLAGRVESLASKIERMDGHVQEGLREVRDHYAEARGMAARDE